jgi:hypothetical protein
MYSKLRTPARNASARRLPPDSTYLFLWDRLHVATAMPGRAQVCPSSTGNPCVLTGQYDNHRDGWNSNEKTLTSTTICGSACPQQLALLAVDPSSYANSDLPLLDPNYNPPRATTSSKQALSNPIYAQPLYVTNIAVTNPSTGQPAVDCDRVTSLAMYGNANTPGYYLYLWPNDQGQTAERLTALQISPRDGNNWLPEQLTGTSFTWVQNDASGGGDASMDEQWMLSGSATAFSTQGIAGDQIVCGGCTDGPQGNCPVITEVYYNASTPYVVTSAGPPNTECVLSGPSPNLYYAGYFINPRPDFTPPPQSTGYPGGSLTVTSSSPTSTDGVVWAALSADLNWDADESVAAVRSQGMLYAYGAVPKSKGLQKLWSTDPATCTSCRYYCASPYSLPTVANGQVFLPTYAILQSPASLNNGTVHCPTDIASDTFPSFFQSGLLVYGFPAQ